VRTAIASHDQSPQQYTLTASRASLNMPGNLQSPDQIKPTVETLGDLGDDGTSFDTTAFARVTEIRFGNVGRNTLRGPGVASLDMSLFHTFKLSPQVRLQFRADAANVTNTPHFANPNGNVNNSNFGKVLATQTAYALGRSREFRFGLRLSFWSRGSVAAQILASDSCPTAFGQGIPLAATVANRRSGGKKSSVKTF